MFYVYNVRKRDFEACFEVVSLKDMLGLNTLRNI